jgi:hypothetical protein
MPRIARFLSAALALLLLLSAAPAVAEEPPPVEPAATGSNRIYLPALQNPAPPNPFGFDLRLTTSATIMPFVSGVRPRWSRAGDLLWAFVESQRGAYDWSTMASLDTNIRRLRAAGIEPTVVVQWSPAWAQSIPGRLCSPPRPEAIVDFARFMHAAALRYSQGDLRVDYWEIWNEPDYRPDQIIDNSGTGCWANTTPPYYGGNYYGAVLSQVYPSIKSANPAATVFAGALAHFWPDDTVTRGFVRGMLDAGAANSFDALSFHAYGEWGAGDRLIFKHASLRSLLDSYGLTSRPLIATEIAATCDTDTNCPPNFRQKQANYAARIYAQAIALNLMGAFWYTLASPSPGFLHSHLIEYKDGQANPYPAYYSFRNSALLLQGARYVGPPLVEPPPSQINQVQVLTFRKPASTLYVFWVPQIDFPLLYNLPVPVGVTAVCTDQLNMPEPATYYCSDTNQDGFIPRAVNELPQYVEVFD